MQLQKVDVFLSLFKSTGRNDMLNRNLLNECICRLFNSQEFFLLFEDP